MIDAQTYMEWSANNDMTNETCWTFVSKVLAEVFLIELPELRCQASIREHEKEVIKQQQLNGDWKQVASPEEGDVVLLLLGGSRPHVGIMIGRTLFLHFSESDKTVKLGQSNDIHWRNRVEGFYRHAPC